MVLAGLLAVAIAADGLVANPQRSVNLDAFATMVRDGVGPWQFTVLMMLAALTALGCRGRTQR